MLRFRLALDFDQRGLNQGTQTLRSLVGPVRAEPGCCATRLMTDMNDGYAVTWVEEWGSWEDFERHILAPTFRRIVAVMELAAQRPSVEIDEVSERHGFEMVEEVFSQRSPAGAPLGDG
jgi:quinol monooxygenase YgiN